MTIHFILLLITLALRSVDAADSMENIFSRGKFPEVLEVEAPPRTSWAFSWFKAQTAPVTPPNPFKSVPRPAPVAAPNRPPPKPPPVAPKAPPVAPPSNFRIDLGFKGVPTADQSFFTNATARWQSIVTGDLPDVTIGSGVLSPGGCTFPYTIDDVHICASYASIDGAGRILGYASPSYIRGPAGLTVAGEMRFDSSDIATLKKGNLGAVILHEMGHVLGIGSLWGQHNLASAATAGCPYRGAKANAEYQAISGCPAVPPETDGGGGTACGHWDEDCLLNELMTGYLSPTGTVKNPLSRISIASLADLGYQVSYTSADSYTQKDMNPSCVCSGKRGRQLRWKNVTATLIQGNPQQRRQLSADAHAEAVQFGQNILAQTKLPTSVRSSSRSGSDLYFIGNREVVVYVEEAGSFFDVVVTI